MLNSYSCLVNVEILAFARRSVTKVQRWCSSNLPRRETFAMKIRSTSLLGRMNASKEINSGLDCMFGLADSRLINTSTCVSALGSQKADLDAQQLCKPMRRSGRVASSYLLCRVINYMPKRTPRLRRYKATSIDLVDQDGAD